MGVGYFRGGLLFAIRMFLCSFWVLIGTLIAKRMHGSSSLHGDMLGATRGEEEQEVSVIATASQGRMGRS